MSKVRVVLKEGPPERQDYEALDWRIDALCSLTLVGVSGDVSELVASYSAGEWRRVERLVDEATAIEQGQADTMAGVFVKVVDDPELELTVAQKQAATRLYARYLRELPTTP